MANTLLLPDTREVNAIIRPELEPSGIDFPLAMHFDAASEQLYAAGQQVQQKPKVRHYPLASLSSRMQRSRAPRPPPSTPPSPSTYVHAGVRNHSGRLRLGPWPRPRQRQPRHYFEAGRAGRRLRPDCRRRSHRECGRRASWRPPVAAGAAARRPARPRLGGGANGRFGGEGRPGFPVGVGVDIESDRSERE